MLQPSTSGGKTLLQIQLLFNNHLIPIASCILKKSVFQIEESIIYQSESCSQIKTGTEKWHRHWEKYRILKEIQTYMEKGTHKQSKTTADKKI